MVEVKLRKIRAGAKNYFSYVITLPKSIIESVKSFKKAKKVDISIEKGKIVLRAKK